MDGGYPGPGSANLVRLIDKLGEELVADFEQYTNHHLVDLFVEESGLTPRLAIVLIQQLPLEARTIAAMRGGDEFRGWGLDRYLLAQLIDAVNQTTYVTVAANSGRKKPSRPKPVDRPESVVKRKRGTNSFARMAGMRIKQARDRKKE